MARKTRILHILLGKATNDGPEEFVFAHTEKVMVVDQFNDLATVETYPFWLQMIEGEITF